MSDAKDDSKRERRHISLEQKVAIVKQHLIDRKSVSDLCDEHRILPTQFYQWQKTLLEGGAAAFQRKGRQPGKSAEQRKTEQLEAKLANKNEVISELMEERLAGRSRRMAMNASWSA